MAVRPISALSFWRATKLSVSATVSIAAGVVAVVDGAADGADLAVAAEGSRAAGDDVAYDPLLIEREV
jgi:hypothetical protein